MVRESMCFRKGIQSWFEGTGETQCFWVFCFTDQSLSLLTIYALFPLCTSAFIHYSLLCLSLWSAELLSTWYFLSVTVFQYTNQNIIFCKSFCCLFFFFSSGSSVSVPCLCYLQLIWHPLKKKDSKNAPTVLVLLLPIPYTNVK